MQPRLARSRLLAKKSSGWFASAEWFMLAVMASIVALGVLVALHHVESSRKVHVQSGMMVFGNTYVVNSTGDGDNDPFIRGCDDGTHHCTLRAAIQQANFHAGTDDITFNIPTSDPGFNNGTWTINLGKALDPLSESLNITGPGAYQLIVKRNSPTGFRIFDVTTTGIVNLSGLTISGGGAQQGSGIYNEASGTLNVTNCALSGNAANGGFGGGVYNNGTAMITNSAISDNTEAGSNGSGGGIYNNGTFTLTGSTVSKNSSATVGGGIYNLGSFNVTSTTISGNSAQGGGGIFNGGAATITNTTLRNNHGTRGGGIFTGGILMITNSTLSGNYTIGLEGGGIYGAAGPVTIKNCTLFGNFSSAGGGIYADIGHIEIMSSTISGNSASGIFGGGGIYNSSGSVAVESSIIALNSAVGPGPDANGNFLSRGFNLIGNNNSAAGFDAATDQTGTSTSPLDPKLDPNELRNNGGPTQTMRFFSAARQSIKARAPFRPEVT